MSFSARDPDVDRARPHRGLQRRVVALRLLGVSDGELPDRHVEFLAFSEVAGDRPGVAGSLTSRNWRR
jgi:hypothetical protein